MRLPSIVLAAFAAAVFVKESAAQQLPPPTFTNVSYGSHPLETMDVYLASGVNQPTSPVLIEMHPGGWAGGEKSMFAVYGGLIENVYGKGISIISINYPLAPPDLFPIPAYACQRAIQFVRSMASAWNIDESKMASIGTSSGAHLALWAASAADAANPASSDPVEHYSSRVRCVVAYEGPCDLTDAYYKFDSTFGHGTSPVWQFLGVTTQAQWDAIPASTKNYLSPRWHVLNGNPPQVNQNLRYLGIFRGDPTVMYSSQLPAPTADIHTLIQGLLMKEALLSIGSPEASVWVGLTDYDAVNGLYAKFMAANWLDVQLHDDNVRNGAVGTPGCNGSQFLGVDSAAQIGNAGFHVMSFGGPGNSLALLLAGDGPQDPAADLLNLGVKFGVNPYSSLNFFGFDMYTDSYGSSSCAIPIPNNPQLVGADVYFQQITVWNSSGSCLPSPYKLSSSTTMKFTIVP